MSKICPKCNNGKLVFYDGGLEHNPKYACVNCDYEKEVE